MKIIDGKAFAKQIREKIKKDVSNYEGKFRRPKLAIILASEDPASKTYVRNKDKAARDCNIECETFSTPTASKEELIDLIMSLNNNENIDGIILQLPLRPDLVVYTDEIINHIDPLKDVDGLTRANKAMLSCFNSCKNVIPRYIPCTASAVIDILTINGTIFNGKHIVIVGRSDLVGRPLMLYLSSVVSDATVTMCHSKTPNLADITRIADIVIIATGKPKLINKDMLKDNAVVIDVGINRVDGALVGDFDTEGIKNTKIEYTPVPGGVGPMTVAELMFNTFKAFLRKYNMKEE